MTELTLTPEYEYFTSTAQQGADALIKDNGAVDVTHRVKSAIAYIKAAMEDRGTYYGSHAWSEAIDWYVKKMHGSIHRFRDTEIWSGMQQSSETLGEDYLSYWVIPLDSDRDRGTLSQYSYLVMWRSGIWVDNIDGAFVTDYQSAAVDALLPTQADVFCGNDQCTASFKIEDGYSLHPYDPESGEVSHDVRVEIGASWEYDGDGWNCPSCTVYTTELDPVFGDGEAFSIDVNGNRAAPFKLQATAWLSE